MGIQDRDYMYDRHRNEEKRQVRNKARVPTSQSTGLGKSILFFVAVITAGTLITHKISPESAPLSWSQFVPFIGKPAPLPSTGDVTLFQRGHSAAAEARFAVVAMSQGGSKTHHLVKLVDANTGEPVLSVFVRSGETASIKVPLGTYKANMASGEKWYGDIKLFGRDTVVQQGKTVLEFHKNGNSITGHTLTLQGTINGNFPTRPLSSDSF
jgi:hypothetical protein